MISGYGQWNTHQDTNPITGARKAYSLLFRGGNATELENGLVMKLTKAYVISSR
jgi:hypothetical protein